MGISRSIALFASVGIFSCLTSPVGWVLYAFQKVSNSSRVRKWARTANWLYGVVTSSIISLFIPILCVNTNAAKDIGPCIIVCNHQSILDLFLLGSQGNTQVCPVTKLWPFRLLFPFAPAMLAAGYINAEGRSPEAIASDCQERIKEGAALVFYPEGKRSRDGKLGKFHVGAFILALQKNLPIVPMIIKGSGKAIPPGSFEVHNTKVEVEMLNPVFPTEYERFRSDPIPHRALMKHIRDIFIAKLETEVIPKCAQAN